MQERKKKDGSAEESRLDRLALSITERVGTMFFFVIVFAWTTSWLLWNMFGPKQLRFDPFPGFVLWLFVSNMIQLFLMPLIMIGQNLQSREADDRAQRDYEINCKAEREIEQLQAKLDAIMRHLQITPLPESGQEPGGLKK
ncbi:MAG TPA: DUF1003 domain-containing protein [Acidisarcina sp.]